VNAILLVVSVVVVEGKKSSWLTKNISCLVSTSTTSFLCIRIFFFSVLQSDAVLGDGGMDSDARVEEFFGDAALHGDANALRDFAGVGCTDVETNNAVIVRLVDQDLHVAVSLGSHLVISPFKGLEGCVEG